MLDTKEKEGGNFNLMLSDKHIVLCATNLRPTTMRDFLNEFYADARVQVCLL